MKDIFASESSEKNKIEKGTLYLVATPIGNMSDISQRAIKALTECDFIAAEDTRVSAGILSAIGVSKSMVSYHEHNKKTKGEEIVRRLSEGESCALVTDAGTPAISDPGADIVKLCIDSGIPVTSVPGACAAVTALILSGFDTRRFVFEGFSGSDKKERRARLEELSSEKRTVIFYEAPHRLRDTLFDMLDIFGGDRKIALCRELTKKNEEIIRKTLKEAVEYYSQRDPRGEYVIVCEGYKDSGSDLFWKDMTVSDHVEFYINAGMSKMDAIKAVAKDRHVPKNDIYKEMI